MNNPFKRITDELFELGQNTKKAFVRDIVKGIPKTASGQLTGSSKPGDSSNKPQESNNDKVANEQINSQPNSSDSKVDPITGQPPPSKRVLTDLKTAAAQLQMQKLQQVRQELAKQRNKTTDQPDQPINSVGPEVKIADKKLDDGAIARTLRASGQTGEFKGSAGGG